MNYFSEFGLQTSFKVNLEKLEELYLAKQLQHHPDKYLHKDEKEKIEALEKTILINQAYRTLKSDIDRAHHLLELKGVELDREEKLMQSPEMLSEAFEERESLSEAGSISDLEFLLSDAVKKIEEYKESFYLSYEANALTDASILYKKILYKNKFMSSIEDKIKAIGKIECR